MITILHIIPTLEGGGAERQLAMIAKEQAKRGWQVHIGLRRIGVNGQLLADSGVNIHQLGDLKSLSPMLFLSIYRLTRQVKPDIIQTWLPQMDVVAGLVARWCSTPWVMTERNSSKAYVETPYFERLRKICSKSAKAIVANSQQGAIYWRDNLPSFEQVYAIHNAVDVAAIREKASVFNGRLKVKDNLLLSVGRLVPEKAHDLLIRATALLPNQQTVQTCIIGKGPLQLELEALIQEKGCSDNISVLPYQPDWWALLKGVTVLVSMSRFEGTPNVLLEAMAAGCPLIVSDIPEHRQILNDQSALFVAPDDVEALVASISSLLSDKPSAEARAMNAACYVEQLTIETIVDAYTKVYAMILERSEL